MKKQNKTLIVTKRVMGCGQSGVEYLGATTAEFIKISQTHPEYGDTFLVKINGEQRELSQRFFNGFRTRAKHTEKEVREMRASESASNA